MTTPFPTWVAVFLLALGLLAVAALAASVLIPQLRKAVLHDPGRPPAAAWGLPESARPLTVYAAGPCPTCGAAVPADSPQGLCPQCLFRCALSQPEPLPEALSPQDTGPYAGPSAAPAVAELAPLFPQFELLELIGQGGMGAVYKARQVKLDRLVAVKVLPAEWGKDPAFAERFAREARALARLSHPHVVAVHDFGEAGGLYYLVMEYVDGANLRQLLLGGGWDPRRALHIVPQVCDALQYAHEEGVVHRDIKPENILVDRRGNVKIADFGLAKLMRRSAGDFSLTGSRQVMGTLDYMAPEQRTTPTEVDHRADVYALGVVFYEMLTGELPLGRFAPPSERSGVDARLDEVVFRALQRDPGRRYQRISEIKTDLELLARSAPGAGPVLGMGLDAEANQELARMRVRAPAVGLFVTGVIVVVECCAFALHVSVTGGPGDLFKLVLAGLGFAAGVVIIRGAIYLGRLENHRLATAAIVLAVAPFSWHCLIGLPMGIWAFWALRGPQVEAAYVLVKRQAGRSRAARAQQSQAGKRGIFAGVRSALGSMLSLIVHQRTAVSSLSTTDFPPAATPGQRTANSAASATSKDRRGALLVVLFVGAVVVSLVVGMNLARVFTPVTYDAQSPPADVPQPLAYYRGSTSSLNFTPEQARRFEEIFRSADQDYLKLEAEHTQREQNGSRDKVTVLPFTKEVGALEDRVWKQLAAALDAWQWQRAKHLLPLHGSLFPFGSEEVIIEMEPSQRGVRWRATRGGAPGKGVWFEGNELPQEYQRFAPKF